MTTNIDRSFPLSGPINLEVRLGSGSVTVTTHDELDAARVRLVPSDPSSRVLEQVTVEMRGATLVVIGPRRGGMSELLGWQRDRDGIEAEIDVPSRTAMTIATASADVAVHGRSGSVDVTTASGDVELEIVDGELRIRTASGGGRIRTITGNATVRTGSGDVRIDEVSGPLQSGFGSGDLDVGAARGPVRSRTGSGDAHIAAAFGDVDLVSGSGEVSIGLPAGLSARLDVNTGSGRVRSDLPVEDVATGERSITVRARTGSGDVHLFRASEAA